MIAGLFTVLVQEKISEQSQLSLELVWEKEISRRHFVDVQMGELLIGGQSFDPATGMRSSPKSFNINIEFSGSRAERERWLGGNQTIYTGYEFNLVLVDDRICKINPETGAVMESGSLASATHPLVRTSPYKFKGNAEQGFFKVISNPLLIMREESAPYHSVVLLDPLGRSPLNFFYYSDLSKPRAALGYETENFNEFLRRGTPMVQPNETIACGDIFTGQVKWITDRDYDIRWAKWVADTILSYAFFGSHGYRWCVLDSNTGKPVSLEIPELKGIRPATLSNWSSDVLVIDDYVITWKDLEDSDVRVVGCYAVNLGNESADD